MSFRDRMSAEDFWDFDLPISRRGRYFHDSSFADTRSDFDRKVRDILREWGDGDLLGDRWADDDDDINLSRYRKLRSRNLSDDNQAVTVTSKDDAHKIVLDVMDFVAGDVKVKVVGELELLVEGRLEAGAEGGTTRTFRRRFELPAHTDMDAITSVLSQDGILTITAPKKGSRRKEETGGGSRGSADSRREHAASSSREEVRSRSGQSDFRDVPFKKMGRFFDDSVFEDSRWDFDRKVRDILSQWGDEDLLGDKWADDDDDRQHTSNLSRYRKLRSRNLTDDNQAVAVTSRDDAHKIVLDVMDFVAGDVKVKVVGDYELLVEGRLEAGTDGGNARTFRRRFELPPFADIDAIMSVLSQDGILTITVPKKGSRGRSEGAGIQTGANRGRVADSSTSASHTASTNTSSVSSKVSSEVQQSERLGAAGKKELSQSSQQSVQASTPASASQVKAESQQTSQNVSFSKEIMSEAAPSDSQLKSVRSEEEDKSKQQTSQVQNASQVSQKVVRSEDHGGRRRIALPITTRGQFFNDSFFESNWKNYQDAVRDVLARWDDRSSSVAADDMTCYRKLRTRDMRDENQAISTSEDETSYKFVVDVHDFIEDGGEVTVNVVEEGQLVVEGRVERRDGGAVVALKHFRREFTLPLNVQQQNITAVMSSDGVLTVIAPKQKVERPAMTQESVSVSKQEGEVKQTQTAAAETVKVSDDSQVKEQSHSSAAAVVGQGSSSAAQESQKEGETIIIPVEIGQSAAASQQEKKITVESQVNFNDDENYKKSTAGKDLAFGEETEADAAHRGLEEQQKQQEEAKTAMVKRRVKREFDDAYKNRLLPIKGKGKFCEDDLFADYQDSFMTAVKDILNKFREPSGKAGALDAYRGLRQRDLKLENQATHVEDSPNSQKAVVDVLDFLDGEVTAEVVDGKELVIKGHAQRRQGSSLTTLTFVRPIPIPEEANLEAISAFVSSDGVLVLNIPKLEEQYELVDLTKMSPVNRPRLSTPLDSGGRSSAERNVMDTSVDLQGKVYRTSTPRDPDRL